MLSAKAIISVLALAGILSASLVQAKSLEVAEVHAPGHLMVQVEERMGAQLEKMSKGALQLQIRHSGQLGSEPDTWEKLKAGKIDAARVNLAVLSKDLPAVKLLSLPYLFRSREHMWRVLDGDFGQRIQSEAAQQGAVVLTYYDSGTRSFYTNRKPIQSLADFQGLRIRVQNSPVYIDLITQLGGVPLQVAYDKVADAFRNGEIDAAENNTPSYVSSGHYKVAKYYSLDEHSSVPEVLLVSKKSWDALTPAEQKTLRAAAEASHEDMKRQWAEQERKSLEIAKKEGSIIVEKSRIAMSGIEGFAVKLYSKYVTNAADLSTVLNILMSK